MNLADAAWTGRELVIKGPNKAYFRTDGTTPTSGNTGVGLAIVKKILDDRKQTITVTSEPDRGCVFSFTWPK